MTKVGKVVLVLLVHLPPHDGLVFMSFRAPICHMTKTGHGGFSSHSRKSSTFGSLRLLGPGCVRVRALRYHGQATHFHCCYHSEAVLVSS